MSFSANKEQTPVPIQRSAPIFRFLHNGNFLFFWLGQTLSNLGDSLTMIALPLLVLQATGSVAQMGLVAGCYGVGQLFSGVFAGVLVDRLKRRQFMIACDFGRACLYSIIPLCWLLIGPQIWLIYVVTFLGSCLGMGFQVAYITAVANLVEHDQVTEANGILQASFAFTYILGPGLAGLVSGLFNPSIAIGLDACSFLVSAITLLFVCFSRSNTVLVSNHASQKGWFAAYLQDFYEGIRFLFQQPVLRSVTVLFACFSIIPAAGIELFVFHLQHDLKQTDTTIGVVFSLANIGAIIGGLLAGILRRRLGFGLSWLGGIALEGLFIAFIGPTSIVFLIIIFTVGFTFADTSMRIFSMSLRQQITPDYLLGRVTSAFWILNTAPGPIGAVVITALVLHIGAPPMLFFMGLYAIALAAVGLFTAANRREPRMVEGTDIHYEAHTLHKENRV